MKYKYVIEYEPLASDKWELESRFVYSNPYNAMQKAVELVMRQHVRHPYSLYQHCRTITILSADGLAVMRLGTRYFVNNL